jgi:hypothetical protein
MIYKYKKLLKVIKQQTIYIIMYCIQKNTSYTY